MTAVATDGRARATGSDGGDRKLMIALTAWVLFQLSRLVAVSLIASVANDEDAPAWMYPAILDVVCALTAPFLAIALWKSRGFAAWTATVVYLTVSIVDHFGFFTTFAQIGGPNAFEGMSPPGGAEVFPTFQTIVDALFLFLVVRRRDIFFKLAPVA